MFDAYEAINDLITDINTNHYNEICDELVYRVELGEVTSEDAHIIADYAYDIFIEKKNKDEDDDEEKEAKKAKRKKIIKRAAIGAGAAAGVAGAVVGGMKVVKDAKSGHNLAKKADEYYRASKKAGDKYAHRKELLKRLGVESSNKINTREIAAYNNYMPANKLSMDPEFVALLKDDYDRSKRRRQKWNKIEYGMEDLDTERTLNKKYGDEQRAKITGLKKIGAKIYNKKNKK